MRGSVASASVGGAAAAEAWEPPELPAGDEWRDASMGASMEGGAAAADPMPAAPAASYGPDEPPPPPAAERPEAAFHVPLPERRHPVDNDAYFNVEWANMIANPNAFSEQQLHWLKHNPLQVNVLNNEAITESFPNARSEVDLPFPDYIMGVARDNVQPPTVMERWSQHGTVRDYSGYKVRLLNVSPTLGTCPRRIMYQAVKEWWCSFCARFNITCAQHPMHVDVNMGGETQTGVISVWMTFTHRMDAFSAFIAFHYAWSHCPILFRDEMQGVYWGNGEGFYFVRPEYGSNERSRGRGGRAIQDDPTHHNV